jgi:hypothetical protein
MAILKNRRGNAILDTPVLLITLFALGFSSIVIYNLWVTDLGPDIKATVNMSDANINKTLTSIDTRFPSTMDGVFAFVFIGLWIVTIVSSFMIDSHPIYFIVALLLLIGVLIFGVYAGNVYQEIIADDTGMDAVSQQFPITDYVLSNLFLVGLVVGISIMIALYGKFMVG